MENKKQCGSCKFLMQASGSMCCGHKEANMSERGNGNYVYPPMDWKCDINKWEQSDRRSLSQEKEMAEVAKEHGWIKIENGDINPHYKRI